MHQIALLLGLLGAGEGPVAPAMGWPLVQWCDDSSSLDEVGEALDRIGCRGFDRIDICVEKHCALEGLDAVRVVVEDVSPELANAGLRPDLVRTDVELRLRLAKVNVVDGPFPRLTLNVSAFGLLPADGYAVSVQLDAEAQVIIKEPFLAGRSLTTADASIWGRAEILAGPRARMTESVRGAIKDMTDEFINEYLKANGGQPARTTPGTR